MKKYARVVNGIVKELFSTDEDIKVLFHPSLIWVEVTNESNQPSVGWLYSNGVFEEELSSS